MPPASRDLDARLELHAYRVLCLLAGVLVPAAGHAYDALGLAGTDPLWVRWAVGGLPLGLFLWSFASAAVRAEIARLTYVLIFVVGGWAVGIAGVNAFAPPYALGLLVVLAGVGVAASVGFERTLGLAVALAFVLGLTAVAAFALVPEPAVDPRLLTGLMAAEALVLFLGAHLRLRTRARLRSSETHYRTVFERAADGLALLDPHSLRFRDANAAYLGLAGRTAHDLPALTLPALLGLPPAAVREAARRALAEGHHRLGPVQHRRRDALPLTLDLALSRVGEGALCLSARDLTEQQRREAELEAAKVRAEQMLRLRATFLDNMSHELRTPLVGIVGFAEVLAEILEDEEGEMAASLLRSARRLQGTLDAILDLTQIQSGTMELDLEAVDVAEVVREAALLVWPIAEAKGLEMKVRAEAGARAFVDRGALHRILLALLSNAVKFTEAGSVGITVAVDSHRVVIRVRDTGPGIAGALLPHLFDPFRQASAGREREHEGSGLGLTIAKHLVDLLHGRIKVESAPGKGTTFSVAFARAQEGGAAGDGAGGWGEAVMAARPRVLLVEDNADARRLMERTLAPTYDVVAVDAAGAALERAQRAWFDAVVVDADLGGDGGGAAFLRQLRTLSAYAFVPALAVTAAEADRARLLEGGFDGCLLRPFTPGGLLWAVEGLHASQPADVA